MPYMPGMIASLLELFGGICGWQCRTELSKPACLWRICNCRWMPRQLREASGTVVPAPRSAHKRCDIRYPPFPPDLLLCHHLEGRLKTIFACRWEGVRLPQSFW